MHCPSLEQLAAYQSELLTTSEHERVHQHLAACQHCRQEMIALDSSIQLLQSAPPPTVPENLWAGVATRLPVVPRRTIGQWWWKVTASSALAAGLVLGLLSMRQPSVVLPVASGSSISYVADHELMTAQDPLADRAGIGLMLASQRSNR